MKMLSVRDLSVAFGGVLALSEVSFDVAEGEIVGIIGPNGAGKTTLLNTISGLSRASQGEIHSRVRASPAAARPRSRPSNSGAPSKCRSSFRA